MERLLRSLRPARVPLLVGLDAVAWLAALTAAAVGWDMLVGAEYSAVGLLQATGTVVVLHVLTGWMVGDVIRRAPVGSQTNAILVSAVAFTAGFWAAVVNVTPLVDWLPMAVPVIATPLALLIQVTSRWTWRRLLERAVARRVRSRGARRTLVVGVDSPARQLVRSMLSDPQGRYWPVGFLAHDPSKRGKKTCGLPILGTDDELASTVSATGCELVVLAASSLGSQDAQAVARAALRRGVQVKALPSAQDLDRRTASLYDLVDVVAAD
jgi:FlaA1/EpsC-like NDP-sugar epimerase